MTSGTRGNCPGVFISYCFRHTCLYRIHVLHTLSNTEQRYWPNGYTQWKTGHPLPAAEGRKGGETGEPPQRPSQGAPKAPPHQGCRQHPQEEQTQGPGEARPNSHGAPKAPPIQGNRRLPQGESTSNEKPGHARTPPHQGPATNAVPNVWSHFKSNRSQGHAPLNMWMYSNVIKPS